MAYEFQNIDYELSKIIDSQNEKIKIQNESDKTSKINETTENDINGLIPESSYAGQVQFDPQNKQLLLISDSDFLAIPIPIEEISLEKSLTFQDRLGFRRQIKGEFFFVFLFTKSKAVDCLRSFSKIKGEIENATFLKEKAEKKRLKVYDEEEEYYCVFGDWEREDFYCDYAAEGSVRGADGQECEQPG